MQSRAKNYLILFLALSTVTAASLAWRQNQRLTQLQSTLSASKAGPGHKVAVAKSGTYSTPTTNKPAADDDDNATANDATKQGGRQRGNNRAKMDALMADPKFAKAWNVEQTARLNTRYNSLFKQLNLSPAQQTALTNLLLERQNSGRDVMDAARSQGLNPNTDRDAIQQMVTQAQAQVDQNIQTTLGAPAYAQYQNYETTQPQRAVVSEINQTLGTSSTPLTAAQSDFLVQALSTTTTGTTATGNQGGGGGGGFFGPAQTPITDAVIAQAQNVLSADQVAALRQLQAQQQAQQTMRQMFSAANAAGRGN